MARNQNGCCTKEKGYVGKKKDVSKKKIVEKNKLSNKRVSQFRNSKKAQGHLSYIFNKSGDDLEFLSMTHTPPKNEEQHYARLSHSVNPKDEKTAYINTRADSDHFSNFGSKKKGYHFVEQDKKLVKKIIKKNKKK